MMRNESIRGIAVVIAVFLFVSIVLIMFGKEIASLASNMNDLQRIGIMCFVLVLMMYIFTFMIHSIKVMKKSNESAWWRISAITMNSIILIVLSIDFSVLSTNINFGEIDIQRIQVQIFLLINAITGVAILSITISLLDNVIANVSKSLKPNERLTLLVATISAAIAIIAVLRS